MAKENTRSMVPLRQKNEVAAKVCLLKDFPCSLSFPFWHKWFLCCAGGETDRGRSGKYGTMLGLICLFEILVPTPRDMLQTQKILFLFLLLVLLLSPWELLGSWLLGVAGQGWSSKAMAVCTGPCSLWIPTPTLSRWLLSKTTWGQRKR